MDARIFAMLLKEANIVKLEERIEFTHSMALAMVVPYNPKVYKDALQQMERTLVNLRTGKTRQQEIDENWAMLKAIGKSDKNEASQMVRENKE